MAFSKMSSLGGGQSADGDGFDPNQPRVPAGQPGGGRWTSLGGLLGGGIARAGEEEGPFGEPPPSSKLPDDAVRLAFAGPEANTTVGARAFVGRRITRTAPLHPDQAEKIFENWSAQNEPDAYAVLELHRRPAPSFRAFGASRPENGKFVFTKAFVQRLTQEDVKKGCRQFQDVQKVLDETYREVLRDNPNFSRAQIGSRLHYEMKRKIEAEIALKIEKRGDPNFRGAFIDAEMLRPERSFLKDHGELPDNKGYGKPGSARPDLIEDSLGAALERLTPNTVCVYEYSIGQRNMTVKRPIFLGEMMRRTFGDDIMHFIVMQMRPSGWRPGK